MMSSFLGEIKSVVAAIKGFKMIYRE